MHSDSDIQKYITIIQHDPDFIQRALEYDLIDESCACEQTKQTFGHVLCCYTDDVGLVRQYVQNISEKHLSGLLNVQDTQGNTMLHYAVENFAQKSGGSVLIDFMISMGADPRIENNNHQFVSEGNLSSVLVKPDGHGNNHGNNHGNKYGYTDSLRADTIESIAPPKTVTVVTSNPLHRLKALFSEAKPESIESVYDNGYRNSKHLPLRRIPSVESVGDLDDIRDELVFRRGQVYPDSAIRIVSHQPLSQKPLPQNPLPQESRKQVPSVSSVKSVGTIDSIESVDSVLQDILARRIR